MSAQPSDEKKDETQSYTALVYFHGIGEQRRYEEVSYLVDALEDYDSGLQNPRMKNLEFDFEQPRRPKLSRDVGYIRVTCEAKNDEPGTEYRFYDAYYANLTAGGVSSLEVFHWLIRQSLVPVKIMFTPWRTLSRLRRATLLGAWDRLTKNRNDLSSSRKELLAAYGEFGTRASLGKYRHGSIRDFQRFLRTTNRASSAQAIRDTRRWFRRFITVQVMTSLVVFTMLLTLGMILAFVISLVLQIPAQVIPWKVTALLLLAVVVGVIFTGRFLRHYLGDLYFWTTYEETAEKNQKRRAILEYCSDFLSHVLQGPQCERVLVIGHSMGTTVAHDTILELARQLRAKDELGKPRAIPRLDKIQHFVTLASPIDKIHYLFETRVSRSYRYNDVIESSRGDLGTLPFSDNGRPLIHWINFWDQADVVSSPLYTPMNHRYDDLTVDNCEVASNFFPIPIGAHGFYIWNKEVIRHIYRAFFENEYNFVARFQREGERAEYARDFIGATGKGNPLTWVFQIMALLVPWLALFLLIFASRGQVSATVILLVILLVDLFLLLAGGIVGWLIPIFRRWNRNRSRVAVPAQVS